MPIGKLMSLEEVHKTRQREYQKKYSQTQKGKEAIRRASKKYREKMKMLAFENLLTGLFPTNNIPE